MERTDALIPYANNARTHSPEQIGKIARSIQAFGFTNPVLIGADRSIIAGHGRVLAARQLGIAEVPVVELAHLSAEERQAYILADNRLALDAGWDDALLRQELGALDFAGFDLSLTGFAPEELAALRFDAAEGLTDPDEAPEAPEEPVTAPGDVWTMGRHRLMCGDSTSAAAVERLADGAQADLCFTSPPYGQQRDYKTGIADWDALMRGVFGALPVKPMAQLLVNLGLIHREGEWLPYWDGWIAWMREQGWRRFGWYVWDQGFGLPGDWNGRLAPSHEWIFHFNREAERARKTKAKDARNIGARRHGQSTMRGKDGKLHAFTSPEASAQPRKIPDSVVRINRQVGNIGGDLDHPAVFPVDLVSEMLTAFSDPDDTVYEPFCGSGTQLISAQKNGRTCLAMEIAPAYCDVAVLRWQNFTGQAAKHEATGRSFAEMAAERAKGNASVPEVAA